VFAAAIAKSQKTTAAPSAASGVAFV